MTRFFTKEIPDNPVYLPSGKRLRFTQTKSGLGIFATTNEYLIEQLDKISGKRGGVMDVSEAEFQSLRVGRPSSTIHRAGTPVPSRNGEPAGIDQLYVKWRIARGRFVFTPVAVEKWPINKIIHVLERHIQPDQDSRRRVMAAFDSWTALYRTKLFIPCHVWDYPRSSTSIGDPRGLPYLKDILQAGINRSAPGDAIMLTNDDTILHSKLAEPIKRMMENVDAISSFRMNFPAGDVPSIDAPIKKIVKRGDPCFGRDLFCFRREWLLANWDSIPDFFLGELEWDLVISNMIRLASNVKTTKRNFCEIMPKCEMPRGYVIHEIHDRRWLDGRYSESPSKTHNNHLMCEWNADNGFENLIWGML